MSRLPCSEQVEQQILAGLINRHELSQDVFNTIKKDVKYFYFDYHQAIYEAAYASFLRKELLNFKSVYQVLVENDKLAYAGGESYLTNVASTLIDKDSFLDAFTILKELYLLRKAIEIGDELKESWSSYKFDVKKYIEEHVAKLEDIARGITKGLFLDFSELTSQYMHLLMHPEERKVYLKTGYSRLDKHLTGIPNDAVIIIGARTGIGKTTFAMNIVSNVIKDPSKKVAYFSLEMRADQLTQKMLSIKTGINQTNIAQYDLNNSEIINLQNHLELIQDADLQIDETRGGTVKVIINKLKELKKVDLVVIDHIGLLRPEEGSDDKKEENRAKMIGDFSKAIKAAAGKLNVPIIVIAQLNREAAKHKGRPEAHHLSDSTSIEQDADVIILLHRPHKGTGDPEKEKILEVNVTKNRFGKDGQFLYNFDLSTQRIYETGYLDTNEKNDND